MTICVAVRVTDCLVFATDSATTVRHGNMFINVYDHANKLFNLYKGLPICAMTCGMGHIGDQSIASVAKDLRKKLTRGGAAWKLKKANYTIEEVATKARKYLFEECYQKLKKKPPADHNLQFIIGGYGHNKTGHETWRVTIENGKSPSPEQLSSDGDCGAYWAGQPEPLNRLIFGYASNLEAELTVSTGDAQQAAQFVASLRAKTEAPIFQATMPVQDAIELAEFMVGVTKNYYRFHPGANLVGGDVDIAVVTRHEGFKWVRRKHYYASELNPLETGHA